MNRKLIGIVLAISILGSINAYADIPDISNLTQEELATLRSEIDKQLMENNSAVVIGNGTYEAGVDIAPGSYIIRAYEDEEKTAGSWIYVFKSIEDLEAYYSDFDGGHVVFDGGTIKAPSGSYRFTLAEGQVLLLKEWCANAILTIEKTEGLFME